MIPEIERSPFCQRTCALSTVSMTGVSIKQLRIRFDISQEALAAALGYNPRHLYRIERSQQRLSPKLQERILTYFEPLMTEQQARNMRYVRLMSA
jgi:DNA-binding transcriptional regulator YiaG